MSYDESAHTSLQRASTPLSGVSGDAGAEISRHEGPCMPRPTGAAPSVGCWVVGLNLLAIRPACLRAKSTSSSKQQWSEARTAAISEQEQHSLQVDLEVVLSTHPTISAPASLDTGAYASPILSSAFPVLLHCAGVELTVLSKHAQLLQQQYSLQQLLLDDPKQHQQQLEEQLQQLSVVTDTPKSITALLQLQITCPSQPTEHTLNCLHLLLILKSTDADPQPLQQHQEQQTPTAGSSSVGIKDSASSTVAEMGVSTTPRRPASGLVAQVPLLVLPAVAQQEVQQLLLPAMRQEVQAEQQQQQPQRPLSPHWPTLVAQDQLSLQNDHRIWQHYQQLANDIHTVIFLVEMLRNPAAEAAAMSIAAAAAGAAASKGTNQLAAVEVSEAIPIVLDSEGSSSAKSSSIVGVQAAAAAAPVGLSSDAALNSIADNLLFPVLLPFLAAHGLQNLLKLLVSYLPDRLQQQWEQQQQKVLVTEDESAATAAAAPAAEELAAGASQHQVLVSAAAAATAAVGTVVTAASGRIAQLNQQEAQQASTQQQQQQPAPDSGKEGFEHWSDPAEQQKQQQQQQEGVQITPGQQQQEAEEKESKHGNKAAAAGGASSMSVGGSQTSAAAAGAGGLGPQSVWWYTPLLQFDRLGERRYLVWKHYTLLHLDYIGALFAVMYLLALLRRMINEPTTLFYLLYVLLKCMPLAPLILGFREPFLRYRELWLWLVIPASILTFFFVKLQYLTTPLTLLPQKALAAYWNGHGELMTSAMRPFIQHMRLRPYVAYTLADAAMCVWVFAQLHGYWAAMWRWGPAVVLSISLCWGLDLHVRRRFVALQR